MPKWIFVTGGVLSGLGKGLVSASVSKLLQLRGQEITPVKCDGYLNVDPGTMNPHEHGEVFVLEDGTEVDMDFGHYERFLGIEASGDWNLTSGKIFQEVIEKERRGEYLGKTVQMVPHVTDNIKKHFRESAEESDADVVIVEVGGTVGDMENQFYLEAVRQMRNDLPDSETFLIHTTLVPYLETVGEQKTKPTQHSVKELRELGLAPDMVVGRSEDELVETSREKISLFCDVPEEAVISDPNLETVYQLPLVFDEQNVDSFIADRLDLPERSRGLQEWNEKVKNLEKDTVARIALCGKYTEMDDSYASIEEALKHSAVELGGSVEIEQIDTEEFSPELLEGFDGVIIPGGFGARGVEGKIDAINYCRTNNVPILGICYGLQLMTVEYARNVLGLDAASEEFDEDAEDLVVKEMTDQKHIEKKGGTMRLGAYSAEVEGLVKEIYGEEKISERHRHRFEVNPEYEEQLEQEGLKISGRNPKLGLAEFIELPDHRFFVGTQAHPEFTSSFENPNPLYLEFLRSCA
ncbi:CTP synthase [Candidatus Nanosalina sp. VS9-1]|uniref:CTP synthase n=1 Tax=Candidatus Nanosalina sp. VS9-1 TaxID=3388566 RepID=UPI0039E08117